MKRTLLQAAVLAALAWPASAEAPADDQMSAFYGNTLTIAVPDAWYYARRFIDPDGTWREPRPSGDVKGVWARMADGRVCHWQTEPAVHNPTRYCYPPQRRNVGDEWTSTDPNTGNRVIQRLEPGREAGRE